MFSDFWLFIVLVPYISPWFWVEALGPHSCQSIISQTLLYFIWQYESLLLLLFIFQIFFIILSPFYVN